MGNLKTGMCHDCCSLLKIKFCSGRRQQMLQRVLTCWEGWVTVAHRKGTKAAERMSPLKRSLLFCSETTGKKAPPTYGANLGKCSYIWKARPALRMISKEFPNQIKLSTENIFSYSSTQRGHCSFDPRVMDWRWLHLKLAVEFATASTQSWLSRHVRCNSEGAVKSQVKVPEDHWSQALRRCEGEV